MGRFVPGLVLVLVAACGRVGFDSTGDAGGGDPGFFGAPRCPSNALLCDSFEGTDIDTSRWAVETMHGTLGTDTTRAARGSRSLRLSGESTTGEVQLQLVFAPASDLPSPVYLRLFLYETQTPDASAEVWEWLFDGPADSGVQVEAENDGTFAYDGWGVSNAVKGSTSALPLDAWACLEWQLSPGAMSMWLDDVAVADMQDIAWTTPPAPDRVAVGLQYQNNPGVAVEAWIDEVVASDSRIGCAK